MHTPVPKKAATNDPRKHVFYSQIYVYVITPFRVLLLVYKPDTRGRAAAEGGGLINGNNTIKGVIKCLLPVARLRDAISTRVRHEMAILRLWSRRDG